MSMEVNGVRSDYTTAYQQINKAEKDQKSEVHGGSEKVPQDEYISSKKAGHKPSGLYGVAKDENGKRKIVYEDPHKQKDAANGIKSADGDKKAEKCTSDTDKVDKEIEKLKEEKQQIQQQLRNANVDEEKKKDLEQKLAQIENELVQKDNDSYRRQNTVVTND